MGLRKPAMPEQIVLVDEPLNQEPSSEFSLIRLEIPSSSSSAPQEEPVSPSPQSLAPPPAPEEEATMVMSNSAPMADIELSNEASPALMDGGIEISLEPEAPVFGSPNDSALLSVNFAVESAAAPDLSDALQSVLAQNSQAPEYLTPSPTPSEISRNVGALPVGDALVPGGAHRSPDIETLKHYLLLREQDVSALSHQLQMAQSQSQALQAAIHSEQEKSADLEVRLNQATHRLNQIDLEYGQKMESQARDLEHAQLDARAKVDQLKAMESRLQTALLDIDQVRERIKRETMQVRSREKELENRLDLLKHDSDAMLMAREQRIIELKRKLDTLEFNFALLQEQHEARKRDLTQANERLGQVVQAMKLAEGLAGPGK